MVRKILPLCSLACAAGGAVCYVLALTRGYDDTIRHFAAGPLPVCLFLLCVLGLLLGAAAGFLARGSGTDVPAENPAPVTFAACAASFLTFASLGFSFIDFTPGALILARMFFQACAAVFLLLLAMTRDKSSQLYTVLSLTPAIFCILRLMEFYYDSTSFAANSPVKMIRLELCVTFALYFTAEARAALGITRPATFIPFATAAAVLGIVAGAGEVIVPLMRTGTSLSLIDGVMYLAVGYLAFLRLNSLKKVEKPPVTAGDETEAENETNDENETNG